MDDLVKRLPRYGMVSHAWGEKLEEYEFGDFVRYDQAAAALEAKDAEIARLRALLGSIGGYRVEAGNPPMNHPDFKWPE